MIPHLAVTSHHFSGDEVRGSQDGGGPSLEEGGAGVTTETSLVFSVRTGWSGITWARVNQPDDVRANQSAGERSAWSHLTEEACFHSNTHEGRRKGRGGRVGWGWYRGVVSRLHADRGEDEREKGDISEGDYDRNVFIFLSCNKVNDATHTHIHPHRRQTPLTTLPLSTHTHTHSLYPCNSPQQYRVWAT